MFEVKIAFVDFDHGPQPDGKRFESLPNGVDWLTAGLVVEVDDDAEPQTESAVVEDEVIEVAPPETKPKRKRKAKAKKPRKRTKKSD